MDLLNREIFFSFKVDIFIPFTTISPLVSFSSLVISLFRVDLPAPLSPMSKTNSPSEDMEIYLV